MSETKPTDSGAGTPITSPSTTAAAAQPSTESTTTTASTTTAANTSQEAAGSSENVDQVTQALEEVEIDPNTTLTVRALVSTKEAGVIIGKSGHNVAELREKTGVKAGVSKVVPGVHDRVLSVSGTLEGIAKAYSLIGQTILENPVTADPPTNPVTPSPNSLTAVRLLIAHNLMGTVIGRAGLKIKHIQDVSGARMVASKEMLPSSTERVVEVQGTVEAIRVAVYEISKCLIEDKERSSGTVLYHPSTTEGAGVLAAGGVGGLQPQGNRRPSGGPAYLTGGMGGAYNVGGRRSSGPNSNGEFGMTPNGSRRQSAAAVVDAMASGAAVGPGGALIPGAPNTVLPGTTSNPGMPVDTANMRTQNISIPSDMVGCIIGKGGSKITEIRRLSGSRISIAKVPHDETGERMFTIQGTPEANEKALFLLYNQLETEKERRTSTVAEEDVAAAVAANDETPAAAA